MVRAACLAAGLVLAGCTLSHPFGTECVSDENCGCASCCIGYRCTAYGPGITPPDGGGEDGGLDGGVDAGPTYMWVVETFAGEGDAGTRDGTGRAAEFNSPTALALDGAGNLYVADTNNNCVRRVTPAGVVSTLAPAVWPCGGTGLTDPMGVAVDGQGNVFVSNTSKNCIKVVSTSGVVTNLAGTCSQQASSCQDSPLPSEFEQPAGLAWVPPYLYVAEVLGNRIRTWRQTDGQVGTLGGLGSSTYPLRDGVCQFATNCGTGSTVTFRGPIALAAADGGVVFVADRYNCAIRRLTAQPGCSVATIGPRDCPTLLSQESLANILQPSGVAAGRGEFSGLVFVGDTRNHRIATLDGAGTLTHIAGAREKGSADGDAPAARFNFPMGVVMDAQGRLFVADSANHRIRVLRREAR